MKKSIKLLCASLLAAALLAPSAHAQISANVALTSDYVWRGVSQNQEDLALQGGFDYAHDSGFYVGVWGSNVNFIIASTELDIYGGWAKEFENGFGVDFGIIRYSYHGSDISDELDFTEYYASVSYAGFGFIYSIGDEFGDQYELSYGYDFEGFSLAAAYGNYDIADDGNDYDYYSVGVSGEVGGIGLDLSYYDTDGQGDALFGELADGRVVFTISKEF